MNVLIYHSAMLRRHLPLIRPPLKGCIHAKGPMIPKTRRSGMSLLRPSRKSDVVLLMRVERSPSDTSSKELSSVISRRVQPLLKRRGFIRFRRLFVEPRAVI